MSLKVRRNACLCCGTCEVCSQQIIDKYHYCPDELTTTENFLSLSYPPPNHSDFYDYIKENSNKIFEVNWNATFEFGICKECVDKSIREGITLKL